MPKQVLTPEEQLDITQQAEAGDFGHPRGTLAIVIAFGALFALGWLAIYLWMFLGRGAPHS